MQPCWHYAHQVPVLEMRFQQHVRALRVGLVEVVTPRSSSRAVGEHLATLVVSPYVMAVVVVTVGAAGAALRASPFMWTVALSALVAGWSSAWSP